MILFEKPLKLDEFPTTDKKVPFILFHTENVQKWEYKRFNGCDNDQTTKT